MGKNAKLRQERRQIRLATREQGLRSKQYTLEQIGHPLLHTEAPSTAWQPMVYCQPFHYPHLSPDWQAGEIWSNHQYIALVRAYLEGFPIGNSAYTILGITHVSERAVHDWRDFQRIKNDICGEEWEGLELYPAESRLVDPSNRFYLWCVPPGVITWGLAVTGRRVYTMAASIAPQRPFPSEV